MKRRCLAARFDADRRPPPPAANLRNLRGFRKRVCLRRPRQRTHPLPTASRVGQEPHDPRLPADVNQPKPRETGAREKLDLRKFEHRQAQASDRPDVSIRANRRRSPLHGIDRADRQDRCDSALGNGSSLESSKSTPSRQAVETLRAGLLDSNISRDIRLSIPRTLSKIASPGAMDALLSGLNQDDGSLRYKIILGLEEMARRLPNLRLDRPVIEMAIVSEARRYYRRFLTFFGLFGDGNDRSVNDGGLLRQTLLENMEREKERVLRLLSLIYPPEDIGSTTAALQSGSPAKQAQAIEFLDNLLTGDVKRHVFPLFDDAPAPERFEKFLALLGLRSFDGKTALQELLKQDDVWLKAATVWEIGLRGLRDFRGELQQYLNSKEPVLKETAELVLSRI
jgi:hypothetical protein